jgi:4-amino-4-deoxy-L-arabinose transferase-like glycosyltransferase
LSFSPLPPSQPHPKRALALLSLIFILLASYYNWASPPFENSDEFFHFPLVKHLADSNGYLPVQSPQDLQDWRQQGNQPPLYHLLAALLIKPFDTSDYPQSRRMNPHAQLGIAGQTNINAVLHPLDRSQEWRSGTVWALRTARFFSSLLALVVVICAYALTRYTFPALPPWVGVLAAALVAFNPMYLFVAASVNNDNLSNALISLILVLLVWAYRQDERPSPRLMLTIGFLLGLSLLSKLSTGPFMALVGLYWAVLAQRHHAWAYMVKWGVATLALALLVSGWWYWRNYDLYGDPTGLDMFLAIVGRRAIPLTGEQLWSEREGFMQSFWGLFGALTVPMDDWAYWGFNGLCIASLVGLGLYYRRVWTQSAANRLAQLDFAQLALSLWLIISLIGLIRWTALTWATQGRLWFIALTSLAAISAVGFYELSRRMGSPKSAWLAPAYAFLIAVLAPIVWIRPAYAAPTFTPLAPDQTILATLNDPHIAQQRIYLVEAAFPAQIQAGQPAPIDLTFCSPTRHTRDWSVFVHLVNPWGLIVAQADFTPGGGALPTSEIEAGYCWQDRYPVPIPPGIAAQDTDLQVRVGLYDVRENSRMVQGALDYVALAQTRLVVGDELAKFLLGDALRLQGYTLSQPTVTPGGSIELSLTWEVVQPLGGDYTAFVQVLNPSDSYRAAAVDQAPEEGSTVWEAGQTVTLSYRLMVEASAPSGVYTIIVGFYQQTPQGAFERLRLSYDGVDTGFDYLTLAQVRID